MNYLIIAKKMIRTILAIGLLDVIVGCEPKPFKGIIVCKEYVKAHMDNEEAHAVEEATFVPRVHYVPRLGAYRNSYRQSGSSTWQANTPSESLALTALPTPSIMLVREL